ncbi:MAG TPA: toll/interleukin-1 receptor domain-containing protein [Caldimonas sp.]|nr:toll/interleukin-1 receptor domain-containing protein [Caldimonas sp.]
MAEVFVSYSHRDVDAVARIATELEKRGHGVWWDRRLQGGQDFGAVIESALRDAKCAVVAWSGTSRRSLWVRAEATLALEFDKLVQLSLDDARPPLPFTMLHLLDFSRWRGGVADPPFVQLEQAVASVVQGGGSPDAPAARAEPRLGGLGRTAAVGAASLALVILAAGLVGLTATGAFTSGAFGIVSSAMLLVAILAFGYMLTSIVTTYLASRT